MKITKKICKAVGIINDWDYANPKGYKFVGNPYLYYSPQDLGRAYKSSQWCIHQHGKNFEGHWRDYGKKTFMIQNREEKEKKFQDALEWMSDQFGYPVEEIIKTPMGSWMHKNFVEKRNKEIEILYKQITSTPPRL